MQHSSLENGRWAELTFPQQMANIGSETSRVLKALEAGKESRSISRFQELFDLTIKYGRQNESVTSRGAMWKELCRFRELYCKAFEDRDLSELAALNRYLDQFVSMR